MEINFIIEVTYKLVFLEIKTYYEFNTEQLDIFEEWYNSFDITFYNELEISRDLLQYKLVETKEESELAKKFIDTFGRSFEILEEIDELNDIFNNSIISDSSSEHSFYAETETINDIIKAHIDGDLVKVKTLLDQTNIDDDIVNDLKKKYN
jgi:hypothetical protein